MKELWQKSGIRESSGNTINYIATSAGLQVLKGGQLVICCTQKTRSPYLLSSQQLLSSASEHFYLRVWLSFSSTSGATSANCAYSARLDAFLKSPNDTLAVGRFIQIA